MCTQCGQTVSGFHGCLVCVSVFFASLRVCVSVCVSMYVHVCVRAQRAMMRFSELELKEKEGGGVCVSAPACVRVKVEV